MTVAQRISIMIDYVGQINLPNENFGITEKTITANEVVKTCDLKALAKEIAHQNHDIITPAIAEMVIGSFCKATVEKMTEGFAIQLMNGNDVAMRIFPDLHINGGNINLKRAKELDPTIQTEEDMVAKAGELIDKAGVKVSVRAVVQSKFTELLDHEGYQVHRTGIVEKSFTKADANSGTGSGDNQGGNNLNPGENDG